MNHNLHTSGHVTHLVPLLIFSILFFTLSCSPRSLQEYSPAEKSVEMPDNALQNFSNAVQVPTISYEEADEEEFDTAKFRNFHTLLEDMYPRVHAHMDVQTAGGLSLIYEWPGSNNNIKPVLLLAHLDVVPVEDEERWTHPPFGGKIDDGYIWGRGTLDDKGSIIAMLEAAELLLEEGFTPERTIYFAFGHDEEIGGHAGAGSIAQQFKEDEINFEYSLDEGGTVADGIVPGMDMPVALIGVAEKGYLSLELSVQTTGGHSSMPPEENSLTIISNAIKRLQDNPFPARLSEPVHAFLDHIGPEQSFFNRVALSNRWLFGRTIKRQYSQTPSGNATVRTTIAPTIFRAGVKDNVIPAEASAIVNFRLLPGKTKEDVISRVASVIDDERINISQYGTYTAPTPVSDHNTRGFKRIRDLANAHYDSIAVAPYLVVGGTDSRHYTEVAENNYRFLPVKLDSEGLDLIHGFDERISIENFQTMISFYYYWMKAP